MPAGGNGGVVVYAPGYGAAPVGYAPAQPGYSYGVPLAPFGPGVGSGAQCPPGPNAPMAAQVVTPSGSSPVYQSTAGVVASGCCVGPPVPPLMCVIQECLPPALLTCKGGFTEFVIDDFTGEVQVRQKVVGCVFEPSDAACCPPDASIIYTARDPVDPSKRVFVATVNGVCYQRVIDGDGVATWVVNDCILKLCGDLKPVFYDLSGVNPKVYTQKDCTQETFRLEITTEYCLGGFIPNGG